MIKTLISVILLIAYFVVTVLQWRNFAHPKKAFTTFIIILGFGCVALHGYWLHLNIDLPEGQNLSYFNIISMVLWLVALLTLLTLVRLPVLNLILFIFPLAAVSILLIDLFPGEYLLNTEHHPEELVHILLSILAYSFLCIGALQAGLLTIQERLLHSKKASLAQLLPPLQTMESFLFQTIWIGFLLLTIVLITAYIFFGHIFSHDMLPKTLLSVFAWCLYAVLLGGRYMAGWRGKIAIRSAVLGFVVLLLADLCTQLLTIT
jgi:ABC-type uncharacterized transport system permease subunit